MKNEGVGTGRKASKILFPASATALLPGPGAIGGGKKINTEVVTPTLDSEGHPELGNRNFCEDGGYNTQQDGANIGKTENSSDGKGKLFLQWVGIGIDTFRW